MKEQEIKKDIHYVGAPDSERGLFDELIPLPDGTSYNAYLIKGSEKTALLDTVDPSKEKILIENLKKLKIDHIDYIVSHHCEQDHSGSIPTILEIYKEAKVVTNPKCKVMLIDHLSIPEEKFIAINDRETISIGGKTLEFIYIPWVHWPETMSTYIKEDKILFSCDFFGSHIGIGDIFINDEKHVYNSAKRYYAEIMMPFRTNIKNNLEKIKDLEIEMICPSHGPVYTKPSFIIDAYKDWISDTTKNEVVIPYVSMHGSTSIMADYLTENLEKRGIRAKPFDLAKMDLGELAMALVDATTIIIGSPTVLAGPHPLAIYATYLVNALRPKTKFISIIGSYGWGGRMVDQLKGMVNNLKVEIIDPVIIKGIPKKEDFGMLDDLISKIETKHKEIQVI
ncbi:MBL fold hydrolase [candidate division WOR-1 bacterium RIFOXYD2_FULL_36_8]|uniref:MBL fold hydrolase n=1 Tax=candidate division WOR-1 bacterium RIFOXYB2_FULL_36_35 TaxID=1802578 RepID=A0A1F4S5T3_UNCSA|nr:MAG: MBL fold hydrolase [candidate division WOR-1 bacterium RIFOXYA2_FULL_36_21]OGC15759.1 MAG: MBL fold hydrolase [candidate division WOR-1 bacterium RIFOXYB2_FULL_36_35]OGC21114.1 MAG: MBL fold hydrolase [candidate division WOR-1 bacterium RIFOXYA12_FULL_36_13]OGC39388.1 MAG: MBL fold hydrolase [candidate division WOR-1 bacterium RIFOXYD2_FULL_36_8]